MKLWRVIAVLGISLISLATSACKSDGPAGPRTKPAIVGFDEDFLTLEGIQKGEIAGTVVQNPYMFGYKSIKILAGLARKDPDVFKGENLDAQNRLYVPHRVIVKNPDEKIGNSETIDVDVFYKEAKSLLDPGKNDKAVEAGAKEEGKISLAFISNNPFDFWTYAQRGCEKAEKDFGIKLEFRRPAKGTMAEQRKIIEDLMIKGVQGIAISPESPKDFMTFLKDDVAAKIPLVMQDNDLPDAKARSCYIGTHNYRAGRAAGALVKKAAPQGGKIVIFVGRMDAPNAIERRQGVLDYLAGIEQEEIKERTPADAQNLKVGEYILVDTRIDGVSPDTCQRKAEDILSIHPDLACLVGLWAYNPPALLRAVQAMK